jgi:hypothetical protein
MTKRKKQKTEKHEIQESSFNLHLRKNKPSFDDFTKLWTIAKDRSFKRTEDPSEGANLTVSKSGITLQFSPNGNIIIWGDLIRIFPNTLNSGESVFDLLKELAVSTDELEYLEFLPNAQNPRNPDLLFYLDVGSKINELMKFYISKQIDDSQKNRTSLKLLIYFFLSYGTVDEKFLKLFKDEITESLRLAPIRYLLKRDQSSKELSSSKGRNLIK